MLNLVKPIPCFEFRDNNNFFIAKEIRKHFDQIWKDEDAILIGKGLKFKELVQRPSK